MSDRKLSVKKELLSELTTDELARVAGAAWTQVLPTLQNCIVTLHGCTTAIECPRPE